MKTNQLMNVAFSSGNVRVYHNTSMGSLTDLFSIGNAMRVQEGKRAAVLSQFLESGRTIEFASVIKEVHRIEPYEVVGRGAKGGTWACLQMMIFAAEYLSPRFHLEVIDAFINNKILEWRDVSGDEFKALNIAIETYDPTGVGADAFNYNNLHTKERLQIFLTTSMKFLRKKILMVY